MRSNEVFYQIVLTLGFKESESAIYAPVSVWSPAYYAMPSYKLRVGALWISPPNEFVLRIPSPSLLLECTTMATEYINGDGMGKTGVIGLCILMHYNARCPFAHMD